MSKKVTKTVKEYRQYEIGDPILGKVRGYPPWPGVVVDPSDAPPAVLNEQPPGKKATFYCILFFPMGDYAWLHSKDLSSLKRHEIEAFLQDDTKKRNGDLRQGYTIALDPQPWMTNRAENQAKALLAEEDAQVDQLESEKDQDDDEEDGNNAPTKKTKAAASKKRKRETDEPTKAPKKAPKAKKTSVEPAKKKAASTSAGAGAAGKTKKNGAKSKAMVESEDEGDAAEAEDDDDDDAGPSKRKPSPPPAKKVKRDKDDDGDDAKSDDPQSLKVRDWRHKLQKTFLSNKALPKAEAMPEIDQLFSTVEVYNDMTIEQLQFSKIGKVMRHIAALSDDKTPPRDDEFKFRARAKGLVDKWHQILNANKSAGAGGAGTGAGANGSPAGSAVGGTTNGNGKTGKGAKKEKGADEVTQATKNIDLNGKGAATRSPSGLADDADAAGDGDGDGEGEQDQDQDQDAPAEADMSVLADVTMSEADA